MESLLGSIWFGIMLFLGGYVLGHVMPISKFIARK
jgi:hypothetical protein